MAALLAELDAEDAALLVMHQIETMGLHETKAWGAYRKRRVRDKPGTLAGQTGDMGGKGGSDLRISDRISDLRSPLTESSPSQLLSEGGPLDSRTPAADPGALPAPLRRNPAVLVEMFTAGVNEAGAFWVCGRGKPHEDLAAALQPHVAAGGDLRATLLSLGRRWLAYCAGAPRDAWKAASWLSEGAPERPRQDTQAAINEAQERAAVRRRAKEAKAREVEWREQKGRSIAPPPEVAALVAGLFTLPPPVSGRPKAEVDAQVTALLAAESERLKAAGGCE